MDPLFGGGGAAGWEREAELVAAQAHLTVVENQLADVVSQEEAERLRLLQIAVGAAGRVAAVAAAAVAG